MKQTQLESAVFDSHLRGLIQGKPLEEKLKIIERETRVNRGRAIMKLRALDKDAYIKWSMQPQEFVPRKNPAMQYFRVNG
jgi:hypothetical protein